MNLILQFRTFYPGPPKPKDRHRTSTFTDSNGKIRARQYTPKETENAELQLGTWVGSKAKGLYLEDVPIYTKIVVILAKPKSKKKTDHYPLGKPDKDNYEKLVNDALNGVIWKDDSAVTCGEISKVYGQRPGVYLEVYTIEGPRFDAEELEEMVECEPFSSGR